MLFGQWARIAIFPGKDGRRSSEIKALAKKAFKTLNIGKPNGPPVYTDSLDNDVKLNQREVEALNLNYATLWVAWIGTPRVCVESEACSIGA